MIYPKLKETSTYNMNTTEFKGYNHNLRISSGEFYDTKNLTSDYYPLLASRPERGIESELTSPQGIIAKDSLAYVDGSTLYYAGEAVTGVVLSTAESKCPKQLVSMGAYLCIFPDNVFVNTADLTDFGNMGMSYVTTEGLTVTYTICKSNSTAYPTPTVSDDEPDDPSNGDLWLDTSEDTHVLKQYSETMSMWVEVSTVYIKISASGIGQNVSEGDGVRISGCKYSGSNETIEKQIDALNTTMLVQDRGDNYIVVIGILDAAYTQTITTDNKVTVKRVVPKMDYVTECDNRLWGCYYGVSDGETVNEIFCCKLGDFKNWEAYAGISTDSFRATCGTDGVWTGAVTFHGYPMFFKENYVHKVYVSSSGAHNITSNAIEGVQKGSGMSLSMVRDYLIYKSRNGVMLFDGSQATSVSSAFGDERYSDAVGGRLGNKYYISMKDDKNICHLFSYDIKKGIWMHEDNTHVQCFADINDDLYYVDYDTKKLMTVKKKSEIGETAVSWEAVTGVYGYEYNQKKYLSRFNIRMSLDKKGWCEVFLQYDSNGIWDKRGTINGKGVNYTFTLPVIPRRCDHVQIKLVGKGELKLYSFAAVLEKGSDM